MSAKGRDGLALVFGSAEYMTWASRVANLIDARKLASEFAGVPKNRCGSKYAQGLQILCRENPPASIPPPPPPSPLAEIWRRDALFTEGGLSNVSGTERAAALATGWTATYVQLLHTQYAEANEAEIPVFTRAGFQVCGWGTFGQGSDPHQDGRDAAEICKRIPALQGWKANGESWAEGDDSWKTEAFLNGWREGGAPVPLGWSVLSSDTANFARAFAYDVALAAPGADIDLQVYGADHSGYTVGAGLGMLSNTSVPVSRTTMSFSINGDGNGPFTDYKTWGGPRRLWRPDKATVATFQALVRA